MLTPETLTDRARRIKLLVFDNDGVLTDGKVSIDSTGKESKAYPIRDGFAFVAGRAFGLRFGIITGLLSPIVETRARQLRIEEVHSGFMEKLEVMSGILQRLRLEPFEAAYMGDDVFDLPVMSAVGVGAAPADADPLVLERADWVSSRKGGDGAARELIELVLRAQGKWDEVLRVFARI